MYLGKKKILLEYIFSTILFGFSGFFIFIGIIGLFMYSSQLEDARNDYVLQSLKESIGVSFGFLVFFIPIFMLGIAKIRQVGKANKFNSLFENDPDGVISVENAAKLFGKPMDKFVDMFSKLVKKGLLINCSLENPDAPVIVLNNGADTVKGKFAAVRCPSCGASNNIKKGFLEKCKYCGCNLSENKK